MNQLLNLLFSISYYSTVLQYKQSRIHRPKLRNKNCSFIFCCIRIRNNNSGSRQKFPIHADPDSQHWFTVHCQMTNSINQEIFLMLIFRYGNPRVGKHSFQKNTTFLRSFAIFMTVIQKLQILQKKERKSTQRSFIKVKKELNLLFSIYIYIQYIYSIYIYLYIYIYIDIYIYIYIY